MYYGGLGQEAPVLIPEPTTPEANEALTAEMNERYRQARILSLKCAVGVGLFTGLLGGVMSASMKKGFIAGAVPGFLGGAFGVSFVFGIAT